MRALLRGAMGLLTSFGLSCTILLFLFVLTYLGTLAQVDHGLYQAQKMYFESWFLLHPIGNVAAVPLPGGFLLMTLLFLNIVCGGILRLRHSWTRVGILITHLGVAWMLLAGFVKFAFADEGSMQLYEGERAAQYQSYYEWEIAITEPLADGRVREYVIPGEDFDSLDGGSSVTFRHDALPFEVTLSHFMDNSWPQRKGPMFDVEVPVVDGFFLQHLPRETEAERNVPGCYAAWHELATSHGHQGILWGRALAPLTVTAAGQRWGVSLRRQRWSVPFTVALDRTERKRYPGTTKPKSFLSDVTVIDGDTTQSVRIQMNEPLRRKGFVLFQSGWGPDEPGPNDRLFSVFAVVRNPADQWPKYSCYVIAIGMLIHFIRVLVRYIRAEARTAS